jgi:flagellar hook assembly protein FlgD
VDGNGIQEATACFAREELRDLLFDLPRGETQVVVSLEANTTAGLRPRAAVSLEIEVPGVKAATVAPNPMPGSGALSFVTSKPGSVQVDLFDSLGRHVRQVLRDPNAPAGPQDVVIDGRDKSGQKLASGVYYFKITSPDGVFSGRAVILR